VTLISAITGLRPLPRRPPPPDELAKFMPMFWCSPLHAHYTVRHPRSSI
jgi:hypothetical protein